ncbi:MAG: cation-transporting P-type ATPase [Planctomycetaceae bacterium]
MDAINQNAPNPAADSSHTAHEAADWHLQSAADVLNRLRSSEVGVSADEARRRLLRYGPNLIEERRRTSALLRLLLQFRNPLIYVLLVTAVITVTLRDWIDAGVILGVVVINAVIGFIQESKAEQAIDSLKKMLAPQAIVLRSGKQTSVPTSELVPGDVVVLHGGDKVPADLRLIQSRNLQVDEAPLTGESLPVEKCVDVLKGDVSLADRRNMAFGGTLVTAGTGTGMVVATGHATQIGRIAGMLEDVRGVDTPLIRRLAEFSNVITVAIIVFCVVIFIAGVLSGQTPLVMLMSAVALAVSAIPEGLPAIMTIALAIGVKRMAARNAVIRKLPAVEALGSTTVICTDKTGTLTRNEMTVTRIATAAGRYTVTGTGYEPTGTVLDSQQNTVGLEAAPELSELLRAGVLCNDASLRHHDGQWKIDGDPTEGALLVLAEKAGLSVDDLRRTRPRTDVMPFEADNQYMATLHRNPSGSAVIFVKGSPEAVVSRCSQEWHHDAEFAAVTWKGIAEQMASEGLRVLAIAEKQVDAQLTILNPDDTQSELKLLGLVGIMDPPRDEAVTAVRKCHAAGIRVKMITGDHIATARSIGREIGISDGHGAVTGTELDAFDDETFRKTAAEADVFARVSPAQKLKLVQALQAQGEVVAMTGDGVNDAPALKQADIGVAMGITGTEVAREAAEMVLLDDNFASIERAVEEGRTVFNNLKKTILFILPTNGGECLTLVAALLMGITLPILPLHILWINLVTTVALAITLAFDPIDHDVMHQPPRNPKSPLVDRLLIWRIVYVSILMAAGTFGLFFFEVRAGHSVQVARAVAVNVIVFFEVAYLFNSRHLTDSILNRAGLFGNSVSWWGVAAVLVFQSLFTYWPLANSLFEVQPLTRWMWMRVAAASAALLLLVEAEKAVSRRLRRRN